MKYYKNHKDKICFDNNYFNKGIKPLFFEFTSSTVHKNGVWKRGVSVFGEINTFYSHKNPNTGGSVCMDSLI